MYPYTHYVTLALIMNFMPYCFSSTTELSREQKDTIIERALNLTLPSTSTTHTDEVDAFCTAASSKINACHYEEAINIILAGLEQFPDNFTLQSYLAALVGDTSEITPMSLQERMVDWAKAQFARLIQDAEHQPREAFYTLHNEYCYRFALYKEQYQIGCARVNEFWATDAWQTSGVKGYYCQGVGAANYARVLMQQGDTTLAQEYAHKAIIAWAQYFSYTHDYYNAYVHYALALGILGQTEEMYRALERSASIIGRDLDYHEFKEVIDFVIMIQST